MSILNFFDILLYWN